MNYWFDRSEQHLDDWEVPLKATSYPQEVKDFWAEQSAKRKERKEGVATVRLKAKELLAKVEQDLRDFGDRLPSSEKEAIETARDELNKAMEDSDAKDPYNTTKLEDATTHLTDVSSPLRDAIEKALKSLLSSAHEAIFAGEKDLLEGGADKGIENPELTLLSETVKRLKALVMMPQEEWNRHTVTEATEEVTRARAALKEKSEEIIRKAKEKEEKEKSEEMIKAKEKAEREKERERARVSSIKDVAVGEVAATAVPDAVSPAGDNVFTP